MKLDPLTHCDFCGLDFHPDCLESGCSGCPLTRQCARIICPRCGYAILPEARLIEWLRNLHKKPKIRRENQS